MKVISTKNASTDGIKLLLYGVSGVGKTFILQTAPNPFIVSSESGLLSLAGVDLPAVEIHNEYELKEVYEYAKKSEYETICIDSISDIAETLLQEFQSKFTDGRQAYGELGKTLYKYIRLFRDLKGKNIVMTAKEVKQEINSVSFACPSMPGASLTTNIPYFYDEVLRMESSKKGERIIHTRATFTQLAKDRSGKLDDKEAPNLGDLINKIKGNK